LIKFKGDHVCKRGKNFLWYYLPNIKHPESWTGTFKERLGVNKHGAKVIVNQIKHDPNIEKIAFSRVFNIGDKKFGVIEKNDEVIIMQDQPVFPDNYEKIKGTGNAWQTWDNGRNLKFKFQLSVKEALKFGSEMKKL
jgi:hypothetical protein